MSTKDKFIRKIHSKLDKWKNKILRKEYDEPKKLNDLEQSSNNVREDMKVSA